MQYNRYLMTGLLLSVSLLLASGCATPDESVFPPAADLKRDAKPVLEDICLESDKCLAEHDIKIEGQRDQLYDAVGRLCVFFKDKGMEIDCTPKPQKSEQ
jgi:hypothetical protein